MLVSQQYSPDWSAGQLDWHCASDVHCVTHIPLPPVPLTVDDAVDDEVLPPLPVAPPAPLVVEGAVDISAVSPLAQAPKESAANTKDKPSKR